MTLLLTVHGEVNMLASTNSACCILMVSFINLLLSSPSLILF